MPYDPNRHRRRSTRLRGYDYSQPGWYFVTVCTQDRRRLFGAVEGGAMVLSEAGRMVERWWRELGHKFPGVRMDAFVVMPDHIHGIIVIAGPNDIAAGDVDAIGDINAGGYVDPPRRNAPDVSHVINAANVNAMVGADLYIRPHCGSNDPDAGDASDAIPVDDVDAIGDINAGGYADPPRRNAPSDPDAINVANGDPNASTVPDAVNAANGAAMVGADLYIRPHRGSNDASVPNDAGAGTVDGDAGINAGGYVDPPPRDGSGDFIVGINAGGYVDPPPPLRDDTEAGDAGINADVDVDDATNNSLARDGASLPTIVQWFKIMTTNEYIRGVKQCGWMPFKKRIWQRNYYEHIIRDGESLALIRRYIVENPRRWADNLDNLDAPLARMEVKG